MRISLSAVHFLAAEFLWPVAARRASSHAYPTLLHLVVLIYPKSMLVGLTASRAGQDTSALLSEEPLIWVFPAAESLELLV